MMKIKSIIDQPYKQPQTDKLVVVNYLRLNRFWKKQSVPLDQALKALALMDSRHELQIKQSNKVTLLDWLESDFDCLITQHAELTKLGKAVCSSLWHKQLMELIFPTLVALRWQYNLVPQIDAETIGLDIESNGRISTISIPNKALYSEDDEVLDQQLSQLISLIAQQIANLFAEQKVNSKRFWGNLSNALAQGFTWVSQTNCCVRCEDLSTEITAWLNRILGNKQQLVEVKSASDNLSYLLFVRRKTCCLKYKLNKVRMCKTCNLVDEQEQEEFYREKLICEGK
ncbi:hypothetical protein [Vibrio ziniensis]|uniref:Ferric siderophore reductase C-terminal domain-containing protein n=1 Tax=Vibrio ziniensis TaxID=2711221 RepID=A0A6G7CP93_9VIBR|nr:hypothetical protein [Vibrio ziniensis]QIH43873.1 hypothetical protein G5S32_17995 [Vibrio ziniensis]